MPQGRTADRLQTLITDLSAKYRTPNFQPHVTLIGELNLTEVEAIAKTARVAKQIDPFEIQLSEVARLDQYFRCVFVKATKTRALINAHSAACAVFKQPDHEEYLPHLSLVYGTLDPQTKQSIIQAIGGRLDVEFMVKEIHLYYTAGHPRLWHRVASKACGRSDPGN